MGIFDKLRRIVIGKRGDVGSEDAARLRAEVVRHYGEGRLSEAADAARRLVEWQRVSLGETHPDYARGTLNLARIRHKQGDAGAARDLAEHVVRLLRVSSREDAPELAESESLLASLRAEATTATAEALTPAVPGTPERALSVLDRVLGLTSSEPDLLADCQNTARALRASIASGEAPTEADELTRGDDPFAALVTLVTRLDTLRDDEWADLRQRVSSAFGPSVAQSASRGRIKTGVGSMV